ncbi:MAG: VanZ family protein [Gemmataceae bacterium]
MRKLILPGLGWFGCLVLWTIALLTIFPVHLGQKFVPHGFQFPAAKCLHVAAYAFLTMYLARLPLGRWCWLGLAILSVHAVGSEFLQQFVPGRHGTIHDVLIDHLGMLLGLVLTWKYWLSRSARSARERSGQLEPSDSASPLPDSEALFFLSMSDSGAGRICR